jgi:hypothetical protein
LRRYGPSGSISWLASIALGLAGAILGYLIFTVLLGIGDTDAGAQAACDHRGLRTEGYVGFRIGVIRTTRGCLSGHR